MLGPIIISILLIVVIPVSVIMTGVAVAAILGLFLKNDVDEQFEGTEELTLSRLYDDGPAR